MEDGMYYGEIESKGDGGRVVSEGLGEGAA